MVTYLDIVKALSHAASLRSGTVVEPSATVPPVPAVVERFRSISAKMQSAAEASVHQEIERIAAMPVMVDPSDEEIDQVSRWYCPSGNIRLWSEQVKALMHFHDYGSVICPIAVGGGKTLISVLVANDAYTLFGKRKIVLMTPSHLVSQLRTIELPKYRKDISINVPFYWLAQDPAAKRMSNAKSGRYGCYVLSYSILSGKEGAEILNAIEPDLIIGDEIHRIASANPSARGRRFREVVKRFNPSIVGLSGTITKKSPRDYHFLVVNALQERSFVPRPTALSDEWAAIIDSQASTLEQFHPESQPHPGPIKLLVKWANKHFPQEKFENNLVGFRNAFSRRMQTTPGVITSTGKDLVGASIRISNLHITTEEKEASPGWGKLQQLITDLTTLWIAPNGDELEHAMHIWRYRYELEGIGGYNNLSWPSVEKIAKQRRISTQEAEDQLERSLVHHKKHQEFARVLRVWIKNRARTGLDTPFLIGQDMYRNGAANVGQELYSAWKAVKDAVFPEIVEREESFVRVCDFRIQRLIKWAMTKHAENPDRGAVIWYDNIGVGLWLRDAFHDAGLPYLHCPATDEGRANISDETKRHCFALATFNAFSEGLNIQHIHDTAAYAQWPRSATVAEQSMGRLHRPGQKSDEVRIYQSICSDFDRVLFAACLNDAAYVHQTVVGRQKLMYADYDERPRLIPYSVLLEWGCEPVQGNPVSRQLLEDKFMEKKE